MERVYPSAVRQLPEPENGSLAPRFDCFPNITHGVYRQGVKIHFDPGSSSQNSFQFFYVPFNMFYPKLKRKFQIRSDDTITFLIFCSPLILYFR